MRRRPNPVIWRRALRVVGVCLVGTLGGALSGFVILAVQSLYFRTADLGIIDVLTIAGSTGLVGAAFGAVFGLFSFPACYLSICPDVPVWRAALCSVPAVVAVELLVIQPHGAVTGLLDKLPDDSRFFFVYIYGGGFVGLLIASIALRLLRFRTRQPSFARPTTN